MSGVVQLLAAMVLVWCVVYADGECTYTDMTFVSEDFSVSTLDDCKAQCDADTNCTGLDYGEQICALYYAYDPSTSTSEPEWYMSVKNCA